MSAQPGPSILEHRHLRGVLEFAVAVAAAGQKLKPPLVFPADLRSLLRFDRLPASGLGKARRAIEAAPDFRQRLAVAATDELVDPIGQEWLRREDGWEDRIAELISAAAAEAEASDTASALRKAERRREAAEAVAVRTRAELAALAGRIEELEQRLATERSADDGLAAALAQRTAELAEARQAARHAGDRATADRQRLDAVSAERDAAAARATAAERQRDEVLASRAEMAGSTVLPTQLVELREIAEAARVISDQLRHLSGPRKVQRVAIAVPGPISKDPARAAEYLMRTPLVLVLVDGYNVAKLAWPTLDLEQQRERLLDAVDGVARRFGAELVVVFDGADVAGAHARRRRLARVVYSPAGVIADDVIRAEVAGTDTHRPVVVVTNDGEIRRDVITSGSNVVASETFVDVALGGASGART